MIGKGKELEFPEGREGARGRRSQRDLNLIALRAIGEPWVPPTNNEYASFVNLENFSFDMSNKSATMCVPTIFCSVI